MADRCELASWPCRARPATVGPFSMRFLRVTHSIPDGMAVAVDTPFGTILHTGDFKIDQTPLDGRPTDLHGFAEEASGSGVHLLLSDSTNAEEAGYTSQRTQRRSRAAAHHRAGARHRGGGLLLQPHPPRSSRSSTPPGPTNAWSPSSGARCTSRWTAARELGLLHVPDQDIVLIEEVDRLDPSRVVVICTGIAGRAVLRPVAHGRREHKFVKLSRGRHGRAVLEPDPGQRARDPPSGGRAVPDGRDVFHVPADPVHASGHAGQEELRLMLSLVRPRWFIPVHGERRHLQHHARLAIEVGIPSDHVIICEDGDVVEVGERVEKADRVQAGMTFVDGLGIGDVGGEVLRDRRKLAGDGVVVVVVTVDAHTGEIVAGPDVVNRGFVYDETSSDILEEARKRVMLSIEESSEAHVTDPSVLQQNVRRVLGRYFYEVTQRKPVILPVIMEV